MTQEQTADLLVACLAYLSPERIAAALHEGLEPAERQDLIRILESELEPQDSSP